MLEWGNGNPKGKPIMQALYDLNIAIKIIIYGLLMQRRKKLKKHIFILMVTVLSLSHKARNMDLTIY
jgi:hypothetical protein